VVPHCCHSEATAQEKKVTLGVGQAYSPEGLLVSPSEDTYCPLQQVQRDTHTVKPCVLPAFGQHCINVVLCMFHDLASYLGQCQKCGDKSAGFMYKGRSGSSDEEMVQGGSSGWTKNFEWVYGTVALADHTLWDDTWNPPPQSSLVFHRSLQEAWVDFYDAFISGKNLTVAGHPERSLMLRWSDFIGAKQELFDILLHAGFRPRGDNACEQFCNPGRCFEAQAHIEKMVEMRAWYANIEQQQRVFELPAPKLATLLGILAWVGWYQEEARPTPENTVDGVEQFPSVRALEGFVTFGSKVLRGCEHQPLVYICAMKAVHEMNMYCCMRYR